MKSPFLFFICFFPLLLKAQDADSLLREFSTYPDNTSKVSLLFKKGFEYRNDDLASAIKFSEACYKTALLVKDHHYLAKALNFRGTLKAQTGYYEKAAVDFEQALLFFIRTKDTLSQMSVLNNLGNVYTELNDTNKALAFFESSLKLANKTETDYWVKGSLLGIATLQMKLNMYAQAEGNFITLAEMCDFIGEQEIISICDLNMGICKLHTGDLIAAEAYELLALDELQMMDDTLGQCDAYANLAAIYLAKNDLKACLDYSQKALNIAQKNNYSEGLLHTWKTLSDYYKLRNSYKESRSYLNKHDSVLSVNSGFNRSNSFLWNEEKNENKTAHIEFIGHRHFWGSVIAGLLILILAIVLIPQQHEQKE
ncbi:MAG: tetratricopeptide repeat protein [Bacteroidia bacterium]